MEAINLFLVDDHKMIREGLKSFLVDTPGFNIVGEAEDGQDCLDQLEEITPDIVLTDLNMPVMDGLELTKQIGKQYPGIKVIALTMMGESQHIKQMLAEGALGYLLKNCGEEELVSAIRTDRHRTGWYCPRQRHR